MTIFHCCVLVESLPDGISAKIGDKNWGQTTFIDRSIAKNVVCPLPHTPHFLIQICDRVDILVAAITFRLKSCRFATDKPGDFSFQNGTPRQTRGQGQTAI